jgi:hypothetical protein
MPQRIRPLIIAVIAALTMLAPGTMIPVNHASAALPAKQIKVHCTEGGSASSIEIYVGGENQNGTITSGTWYTNLFGTASTDGWWWRGDATSPDADRYVSIMVKPIPNGSWVSKGQFVPSGGTSTFWNNINVSCL